MYVFECLGLINHILFTILFTSYYYDKLKCERNSTFYAYVSGRALVARRNNNGLILFDGNLPA